MILVVSSIFFRETSPAAQALHSAVRNGLDAFDDATGAPQCLFFILQNSLWNPWIPLFYADFQVISIYIYMYIYICMFMYIYIWYMYILYMYIWYMYICIYVYVYRQSMNLEMSLKKYCKHFLSESTTKMPIKTPCHVPSKKCTKGTEERSEARCATRPRSITCGFKHGETN